MSMKFQSDELHFLHDCFDAELRQKMQTPVPPARLNEYSEFAICAEVAGTIAIENEPGTFEEIVAIIAAPLRSRAKDGSLRAARNVLRALAYIRATRPPYALPTQSATDCNFVQEIHHIALNQLIRPAALGAWRESEVGVIGPDGAIAFRGTPASELDEAMARWSKTYDATSYEGHPLERLADSHAQFESIHPFVDGNGRTGRLLIQAMAIEVGLPFLPISKLLNDVRHDYFRTLAMTRTEARSNEWRMLFADICIQALRLLPQ